MLAPLTQATFVTARAKLPDDLVLGEYTDLVGAFATIMHIVARKAGRQSYATGEVRSAPPVQIERAQYGSDFLMIVSIATVAAGAAGAIGSSALLIAKAVKTLEESGLVREQRLELRDARLERRKERREATERLRGTRAQSPISQPLDAILTPAARDAITAAIGTEQDKEVHIAIGLLAEYHVELEVAETR